MRTLKRELVLMNIAATGAALLVAIALLFSAELRTWKEAIVRDIAIKADIIGGQCTAALTFNASKDAEEVLRALQADAQIEHAAVYSSNGALFAAYRGKSGGQQALENPPADGHRFKSGHLDMTRPIMLHGERIGAIFIRANLDQLRTLLLRYGLGSATALLIALAASSLMLSRLQRSITEPVTSLVKLMEKVSRDKDYARRADSRGPREFVSLAGSFNDMLTAIQSRDRELGHSLAELKTAYGKLEDLDRLKSDFISTVSHELRTPITSIKAFVELLLIKPYMNPARKGKLLETINSETDRLSRLISDLLDLSRIESGVMLWRDIDLAIDDVVRSAIDGMLPLAQKKGIRIEMKTDTGMSRVYADRDRIMQVVMNILSNATKFTPDGGTIRVKVGRANDLPGVCVSVADTGPGIAPEDLKLIFGKFQRSGDVLTNAVEGTGLGLAISRQIVEHYGGSIWASSEPGQGSVFTFLIPFEMPAAGTEPDAARGSAADLQWHTQWFIGGAGEKPDPSGESWS
jgi:signal transduction histidine kinase